MTIKSVKNALSFGRRKSVSEEQNLLGSSMETDRETEDETGAESQEEIEKAETRAQRWHIETRHKHQLVFFRRESLASFVSDNESILSSAPVKKKSKRSRK
jgi:hypothetical protein